MALTSEQQFIGSYIANGTLGIAPGGYMTALGDIITANGSNYRAITKAVVGTSLFTDQFPTFLANDQFATNYATKLLGTSVTAANLKVATDYITGQLNAGVSRGDVVYQVLEFLYTQPSTNADWGTATATLQNKASVAQYYTVDKLGTSTDTSVLSTMLSTVTQDAATVTAAKASIDSGANGSGTGTTYTLTKSVQALTGTAGNDIFIAGDEGGSATLNAGDQISGGAGTDTLKIFNAATVTNGANFTTASISGVENVEFTSAATTQALDVSGNADVTKVTLVNGLDAVVTAKLTQTVGLKGNINTNAAATSFVFTSVDGDADSANVVLDGASTAAGATDKGLTLQDVETLNLALTGTNVVGSFDSDATKLVITGAGSLKTVLTETTGTASLVKTIDASAATGALDIDNKSFAGALETITLGSGNDRYVSLFSKKDALDKIDLGAGTNDILAFADATDLSTATKALVIGGAKNYEAIEVTGGAFAMKVDGDALTGIKSFIADTTGALTATNIYSGTKVTVGDVVLAASTVGMKLGEKVLDVALAGTKTAISNAVAGITVTGATDINVTSNGFADQAENKLKLTSDDNSTLKISGAKDVILTTVAATATTGFTIDGSAATGKLTITGTTAADIIKGGSAVDTLNGGAIKAGVTGVTAVKEVQTFTITGAATSSTDIVVNGVNVAVANGDTVDQIGAKIAAESATIVAGGIITTDESVAYDAATDTVTVTYTLAAGSIADNTTTISAGTSGATFGAVAVATQGVTAVTAVTASMDTLTGNGGADIFAFSSADLDTAAGAVTAVITDFKTGLDTIKVTNAGSGAGSATNYVEATTVATSLENLLTAADTALTNTVLYYVGQVGADSYLVTDADSGTNAGYTNVIKLTGVSLDQIAATDLIA